MFVYCRGGKKISTSTVRNSWRPFLVEKTAPIYCFVILMLMLFIGSKDLVLGEEIKKVTIVMLCLAGAWDVDDLFLFNNYGNIFNLHGLL